MKNYDNNMMLEKFVRNLKRFYKDGCTYTCISQEVSSKGMVNVRKFLKLVITLL